MRVSVPYFAPFIEEIPFDTRDEDLPLLRTLPVLVDIPYDTPDDELQSDDGEPLESAWHRDEMNLLIEVTRCHLQGTDFFTGGTMFIYFKQKGRRKRQFRGPDYFLVKGVKPHHHGEFWCAWEEGYPNLIIELGSPSTIKVDKTTKKKVYQSKFGTHEYFLYDPNKDELFGWRLAKGRYKAIQPNEKGWMWCEEMGCWLGTCQSEYLQVKGKYLRFFDQDGRIMPTFAEAERQNSEAEQQRAEAEKQRADAAEAALAKLLAQQPTNGNGRKKKQKP